MRIAFATSAKWSILTESDSIVAEWLRGRCHEVVPAIWDDSVDWRSFDAVVIRSCWDYHRRPAAFLEWLESLITAGVRIWNDPRLVAWNVRKTYLFELQRAGIPIIDTIAAGDGRITAGRLLPLQASRYVVKPVVSASSEGLFVLEAAELPREVPWEAIVQPFVADIEHGEKSVIAFGGEIAHAVLKRPAPGDFRVQRDFGGSAVACRIEADERAIVGRTLEILETTPLYARIDLLRTGGRVRVMEVELIEPELFIDVVPASAAAFGGVIERWIRGSAPG